METKNTSLRLSSYWIRYGEKALGSRLYFFLLSYGYFGKSAEVREGEGELDIYTYM